MLASYVGLSISNIAAETKTTGNNCYYPKKISDTCKFSLLQDIQNKQEGPDLIT